MTKSADTGRSRLWRGAKTRRQPATPEREPFAAPALRHPVWAAASVPVAMESALRAQAELEGDGFVESLVKMQMVEFNGVTEWRLYVCMRGRPHLVVTAVVTAVGEYLPPHIRERLRSAA